MQRRHDIADRLGDGERAGEAAAEAQAASTPKPAEGEPRKPAGESEEDDKEDSVREAMERGRHRRNRTLGGLLDRAKRLSEMRQKLGQSAKSGAEIEVALSRVGYEAAEMQPDNGVRVVTTSDAKAMLRHKLDAEKKLEVIVASLAERRAKQSNQPTN
jgi:hypothetical protein